MQDVLAQLPWYHQLALLDKLGSPESRRWYAAKAIEHNWSRNVLAMQIETRLLERSGKAVTNFAASLPKPQSDLARESVRDPYRVVARADDRVLAGPGAGRDDDAQRGSARLSRGPGHHPLP